jgi:hypothetical protein
MKGMMKTSKPTDILLVGWLLAAWPSNNSVSETVCKTGIIQSTFITGLSMMRNFVLICKLAECFLAPFIMFSLKEIVAWN